MGPFQIHPLKKRITVSQIPQQLNPESLHPICMFNVYVDPVMKEVKIRMGRRRVSFLEDGREWRLPGLLYADDLFLCGELEEELRVMVERFAEVCRRIVLKVNAGKGMVMVLNGE